MPEETIFAFERDMDRAAVAEYLHTVADRLESGREFSLDAGGDSVTLAPPGSIEFEVEVERETEGNAPAEIELEFELEWEEGATGDGDLSIG